MIIIEFAKYYFCFLVSVCFLNEDSKQNGTQSLFPDLLVKGFLPQSFWRIPWSEAWWCCPTKNIVSFAWTSSNLNYVDVNICEHTSFLGVWNVHMSRDVT